MSAGQYHWEARRKQRMIEKSHQQQSQAPCQVSYQQTAEPGYPSRRLDSGYRSCQYDRGLWNYGSGDSSRDAYVNLKFERGRGDTSALAHNWQDTYRELKQHQKKLRNHNMYMGPLNAFADLFQQSRYSRHTYLPESSSRSAGYERECASRSAALPGYYRA